MVPAIIDVHRVCGSYCARDRRIRKLSLSRRERVRIWHGRKLDHASHAGNATRALMLIDDRAGGGGGTLLLGVVVRARIRAHGLGVSATATDAQSVVVGL